MCLFVSVRLEAVQQLSVETESEGSVRVQWRSVGGARAYRLVWGPFTGERTHQTLCLFFFSTSIYLLYHISSYFAFFVHSGRDVETVEVGGDVDSYALSGVQPDTEYIVTIIPLYEGNTEGPAATARFKIGGRALGGSRQHKTLLSVKFPLLPSPLKPLFPCPLKSVTHSWLAQ